MPQPREDYKYYHIAGANTYQVKEGAGILHAIVIGTTDAGAISVIDNTSGSTVNILSFKASVVEGTYKFNCKFTTGLRIITAGASDICVIYS